MTRQIVSKRPKIRPSKTLIAVRSSTFPTTPTAVLIKKQTASLPSYTMPTILSTSASDAKNKNHNMSNRHEASSQMHKSRSAVDRVTGEKIPLPHKNTKAAATQRVIKKAVGRIETECKTAAVVPNNLAERKAAGQHRERVLARVYKK
uniref:Uncharacterized protein n=1 Tax=Lygus hesperus TaxID=30085 RepID=A0A146KNF1_LYGHE